MSKRRREKRQMNQRSNRDSSVSIKKRKEKKKKIEERMRARFSRGRERIKTVRDAKAQTLRKKGDVRARLEREKSADLSV
jgi:hypothetical protein